MIQILIVDDHPLVREGLKRLFISETDMIVIGEAGCGGGVLTILQDKAVDLVLLDISIPGIHGAELINKIKESPKSPPILILSMHDEPEIAKQQLDAGASGYVTKDVSPVDLLSAMRIVAAGGCFISAGFNTAATTSVPPHSLLSARELLILKMLAKGKKVNEIALELHISN
jgi:DNA-binding NarL/FixJ family response regulator